MKIEYFGNLDKKQTEEFKNNLFWEDIPDEVIDELVEEEEAKR